MSVQCCVIDTEVSVPGELIGAALGPSCLKVLPSGALGTHRATIPHTMLDLRCCDSTTSCCPVFRLYTTLVVGEVMGRFAGGTVWSGVGDAVGDWVDRASGATPLMGQETTVFVGVGPVVGAISALEANGVEVVVLDTIGDSVVDAAVAVPLLRGRATVPLEVVEISFALDAFPRFVVEDLTIEEVFRVIDDVVGASVVSGSSPNLVVRAANRRASVHKVEVIQARGAFRIEGIIGFTVESRVRDAI